MVEGGRVEKQGIMVIDRNHFPVIYLKISINGYWGGRK